MRDQLEHLIPGPLYGCFFTLMTCLSLLLLILAWQTSPTVLWQLDGWAATLMYAGYVLSWVGLFYSLSLTGYGFQTGWTPYWAWVRGRPKPRRRFEIRGAYRWLRHPVYLSFLGLVWFTPLMTLDRAVLTGLMTVYIFVGSALKDLRLGYYLGDIYRQYQARVPGYPVIGFGPLGRVPCVEEDSPSLAVRK
jgi:protein-S-isoprenylcysteine O-methyltransferase Ste14